jgi:hypothetical protein
LQPKGKVVCAAGMDKLPPLPSGPKPGLYRHYKGNNYRVVGLARHSETLEPLVVYQALYGDGGLWVRPAAMFTETVAADGKRVPRFARTDD